MRLVACKKCRSQYDVSRVNLTEFNCSCGAVVHNHELTAVDARIRRCGSCGASLSAETEICEYCRSAVVRDPGKLSLICPECFARNAETSRFCGNCGVEFKPREIPAAAGKLLCPACSQELSLRGIGDVFVSECLECNGLWVPDREFDRLMNRAIEAQHARPSDGLGMREGAPPRRSVFSPKVVYRKCPECGGIMQRKNFGRRSGVIVDWCGKHGAWLDADELEAIADFIIQGGLERASLVPADWDPQAKTFFPASAEKIEGMVEAEKLLARERGARGVLTGGPGSEVLRTLGDLFRTLLD